MGVSRLFNAYRVLATIVGVLLMILVFVAVPLKYLSADGSSNADLGETLTSVVGVTHGWMYIAYLGVSLVISRRARWPLGFTLLTMLAGLVPILIFWVEHRVVQKFRAEHPDLEPVAHSGG